MDKQMPWEVIALFAIGFVSIGTVIATMPGGIIVHFVLTLIACLIFLRILNAKFH
jgi:hypothetical protein